MHRDQAREHARLGEVLLKQEMSRSDNFLDLMVECAVVLSGGQEPTGLDWVFARAQAAAVWRYDRETSDGQALAEGMGLQSYNARRADVFRDADTRVRLKSVHMEDIRRAREMHQELRAGVQGAQQPRLRRVK